MASQRCAFVVAMKEPAFLKNRDDAIHEGIDPVFVNVGRDPEAISGTGFEPFLHVVGGLDGWSDNHRMIINHTMGQDVTQSPALTRDFQSVRGTRIAWR